MTNADHDYDDSDFDFGDDSEDDPCPGCDGEGCPLCCGIIFAPGSEQCEMCAHRDECG